MLGVAAALLIQLGRVKEFDLRQAIAASLYVATLGGLFATRKWLADLEHPDSWSPVTWWRRYRRKRRLRHRLWAERSKPQHAETAQSASDGEAAVPTLPTTERGVGLEALDPEVLVRRSLDVSPSGYLTIISIIQGVALALLAERTIPHLSVMVGAQAVAVLTTLVFVFYFYTVITVLMRWPPSILDALLPFAIGCLEVPPVFFLGRPLQWSVCAGAFWAAALAGLEITRRYSPASHFGTYKEA